jgi:hypothetical protein
MQENFLVGQEEMNGMNQNQMMQNINEEQM